MCNLCDKYKEERDRLYVASINLRDQYEDKLKDERELRRYVEYANYDLRRENNRLRTRPTERVYR